MSAKKRTAKATADAPAAPLGEDELQSLAVDLCERLWKSGHRADDVTKWAFIGDLAPMLCDQLRAVHSAGYEEGYADAAAYNARKP